MHKDINFGQYLTIQHWHNEWLDPQNVRAPPW